MRGHHLVVKPHEGIIALFTYKANIFSRRIGIAGITIYGPTIFKIAGISTQDQQWVSGLNDITYMVCF